MVLLIIIIAAYAFVTGMLWKWADNKEEKEGAFATWLLVPFWPFLLIGSPLLLLGYAGYWITEKLQKKNNDTPRSNR